MCWQKCTSLFICSENEDSPAPYGHITSLAVHRPYRRLGIAEKLMRQAGAFLFLERSLRDIYKVDNVTLHVRMSNAAAFKVYKDVLRFE